MAIHHFGTGVDGSVFVEQIPSSPPATTAPTDAPQRPGRGLVLSVRNAATNAALPDIVTKDFGYWDYVTVDIPIILVSADNFASTPATVRSKEALDAAATASVDVPTALANSQQALTTAQQALTVAQQNIGSIESVNGQRGSVILTAADVGARAAGAAIPATDITGLSNVAKSGAYLDLSGIPAPSIPSSQKGTASGVATLDVTGRVPLAQLPPTVGQYDIYQGSDGVWPLRNSVTSDSTVRVNWWYFSASSPNPQAGNGYVQGKDVLYKKV